MVKYEANILSINGRMIKCEDRIEKVLVYQNLYIVFLVGENYPGNNIFAINDNGDRIWDIKNVIKLKIDESYVAVSKLNDEELKVISASGIKYIINVYTKDIIKKQIVK